MNNIRVAVTGIGSLCGLGTRVDEVWPALIAGKSGVHILPNVEDGAPFDFPVHIAGYPKSFSINSELLEEKEKDRFDTFIQYGLHCTDEALKQAKLGKTTYDAKRIGVIVGVGMGGFPYIQREDRQFVQRDKARTSPFFIPSIIPNMASGMISIKNGFRGTNFAISSACASSGHALEVAFMQIKMGLQDAVVTGGTESVTTKLTIGGFHSMKALSRREVAPESASCPFSGQRDGFVLGEGAGILILENYDKALKRGATILAEVVGIGSSSDANHITAPHPEGIGAIECMKNALEFAQIKPDQIDYINAHGTSTPLGDKIETHAIKEVFKDHAYKLNISSTKSMTGHLLGAASGFESIVCVKSILEQKIAPTINLDQPDPDCDLNYTANKAVEKKITYALNNSFGFGGTNSCIIFKKV